MKLYMTLLLHQFCMTLLSERGESNKTNAKKVSNEVLYEAPLARKTRLESRLSALQKFIVVPRLNFHWSFYFTLAT